MSNTLAKLKRNKTRMNKHDAQKAMRQVSSKNINFHEQILPNTLYVDVKASSIKVSDGINPIGSRPVAYLIEESEESFDGLLSFLQSFDDESIKKVVMDNGDGFKIKTLKEFTFDVKQYIEKFKGSLVEADDLQ